MKQAKNLLDCKLEKKLQEIHQLEEELNIIKQSLKQSQNFAEEMKSELCIYVCRTSVACLMMYDSYNPVSFIVN